MNVMGIMQQIMSNNRVMGNPMIKNAMSMAQSGNSILDYLCNEKISSLQAENNDLRRAASQDRQSALLTTQMAAQTQQIINAVNPAPIPAYTVPNPNAYYGCGCNTGCNC